MRPIHCARCDSLTDRTSSRQKYCVGCSGILGYHRERDAAEVRCRAKEWRSANLDRAAATAQKNYENNRKSRIKSAVLWAKQNKERRAEIANASGQRRRKLNPEVFSLYKKKRRSNPAIRLNENISSLMRISLSGSKNSKSWKDLVGYSIQDLRIHLERQFIGSITWENYGSFWHVDHILPIASFSFSTPEDSEFKMCWALSNLRPLPAKENMSKGKRRTHLI